MWLQLMFVVVVEVDVDAVNFAHDTQIEIMINWKKIITILMTIKWYCTLVEFEKKNYITVLI